MKIHPAGASSLPDLLPTKLIFRGLGLLILALALEASVQAATWTWDGGGSNNDWKKADNWTTDTVPESGIETSIVFAGTTRLSPSQNVSNPLVLNALTFASESGAFVSNLGGLDFRSTGAGAEPSLNQLSASDITINNSLTFTDTVNFLGTGNLTLHGPISGSTLAGLSKTGTGKLVLAGTATLDGFVAVHSGLLEIASGGSLFGSAGEIYGGFATVTGTGSLWDNSVFFQVGGNGTLTVENSGKIRSAESTVGTAHGSGTATVTGANSHWEVGTILNLGRGASGTLRIENGGKVTANAGRIGYISGSGSATVTGANSLLQTTQLSVGFGATGTLLIENGGKVIDSIGDIGRNTATDIDTATSTATVTGANSLWENTSSLFVGRNGEGTLNIESGGRVTAPYVTVSATPQSRGIVNLTGAGGLSSRGVLETGYMDKGDAAATAAIHFNGGILRAAGNEGNFLRNFAAGEVEFLAGGAFLDTQAFDVGISTNLTGVGGLTKMGSGKLTLTGANTFQGGVTIQGGILSAASDAFLGDGDGVVAIQSGRLLYTGNVTTARTFNLGSGSLEAGAGITVTYSGATLSGGFLGGAGVHRVGSGNTIQGITTLAGSNLSQTTGQATVEFATFRGNVTQSSGATLALHQSVISSAGKVETSGVIDTTGVESSGVLTIHTGGRVNSSGASLTLAAGSRTTVENGGTLAAQAGSTIELNGGLLVNNGTQSGVLNVNFISKAKGAGSFGSVHVADGGTFAPGNSPGTANVEGFEMGSGGRYEFELTSALSDPGVAQDLLLASGLLEITAGQTANTRFTLALITLDELNHASALDDFDAHQSYTFLLADAGSISGFNSGKFAIDTTGFLNDLEGGSFSVYQQDSNLYLHFAAPEPATMVYLAAGLAPLLLRRRRQS